MRPNVRLLLTALALIVVLGVLVFSFPSAYEFVELAARELRYFWWLVLIVGLAIWLIFGFARKPRG
jgi:hypothetical protein